MDRAAKAGKDLRHIHYPHLARETLAYYYTEPALQNKAIVIVRRIPWHSVYTRTDGGIRLSMMLKQRKTRTGTSFVERYEHYKKRTLSCSAHEIRKMIPHAMRVAPHRPMKTR